jgi:hypothetical protein
MHVAVSTYTVLRFYDFIGEHLLAKLMDLLAGTVGLGPCASLLVRHHALGARRAVGMLLPPGLAAELLQFLDASGWMIARPILTEIELLLRGARNLGLGLQSLLRAVVCTQRQPVAALSDRAMGSQRALHRANGWCRLRACQHGG